MYPLKTKEETYRDYMNGILELDSLIQSDEFEIERRKNSIKNKQNRLEGLKEMAELYAPSHKK